MRVHLKYVRTCGCLIFLLFSIAENLQAQKTNKNDGNIRQVSVKGGSLVMLADTSIYVQNDTLLNVPAGQDYHIRKLPNRSSDFMDALRIRARKNLLTRSLYNAVLVQKLGERSADKEFDSPEAEYLPFQGKTIRQVRLLKVDVLKGVIQDTVQVTNGNFSRILNRLHVKTRDNVIYRNLLFESGDSLDAMILADNERILRSLQFIEDARFQILPVNGGQEVDIVVITKDVFSLGLTPNITSPDVFRGEIYERNLLGWGSELKYTLYYDARKSPTTGYDLQYNITNIQGSFIDGLFNYNQAFDNKFYRAGFEKQFLTPQTRYAGSFEAGQLSQVHEQVILDTLSRFHYTTNYLDFWAGRSFQVGGEKSRRNLIIEGRLRRDRVLERPYVSPDSNHFYHGADLILGSISFREIRYYKSNLMLSFGTTEDIPVGFLYQLTAGIELEEFKHKPYLGLEYIHNVALERWGFVGIGVGMGGFYYDDNLREGVVRLNSAYFTPLLKWQRFRFRNIANLNLTLGIRRRPAELITLNGEIRALSADQIQGTHRFTLSLESVAFSPWVWAGFRFAFYTFSDVGFLSETSKILTGENFYGSLGIGCRIRNESLVFNTLILRLAFFPRLPEGVRPWTFNIASRNPMLFTSIGGFKPSIIEFR